MEQAFRLLGACTMWLVLWAILASPVLVGTAMLLRHLRKGQVRSPLVAMPIALGFALLAAPVPTPIITVFIPHGLALFDAGYYGRILGGHPAFDGLMPWVAGSLVVSFMLAFAIAWRSMRTSGGDKTINRGRP